MMNNNVCIFPDTMPKMEILFPLVQFFDQVVHLSPVENDASMAEDASAPMQEMIEQELVRFACTAPLGDNRDRFLQLVHDLQHRPDDYAAQLSHLALAGLGSGGTGGLESRSSIISTLLRQTGIEGKKTDDTEDEQLVMILWQARLLLKLGESFDRGQETLQENLKRISAQESGLLQELRDDDGLPFADAPSGNGGMTNSQLQLRLKAWSRLFALGKQPVDAQVFVTTSRDGLDLLVEQYNLEQDCELHPFLNLSLPMPGSNLDESFIEQRNSFQEGAAKLIETIRGVLDNPGSVEEQESPLPEADVDKWNDLLDQFYPAAENGRCRLTLYSIPDVSPEKLFLETFGQDDEQLKGSETDRSGGTMIGILEKQVKG